MFRKGQSHATMSFCIRSEACLTLQTSRNGPLSTRRGADILVCKPPTHQRRHLPPPQTYTCLTPKVGEQFQYRAGRESVDKFSTPPPTNDQSPPTPHSPRTHLTVPALDAGSIHCQRQRTVETSYGPRIKCGDLVSVRGLKENVGLRENAGTGEEVKLRRHKPNLSLRERCATAR